MCGRYFIDLTDHSGEMAKIIDEINRNRGETAVESVSTGEIYPTNIVPVIIQGGRKVLMKWGFSNSSSKKPIINARSETALEKPTFRRSMMMQRCLVPASHYFEWEHQPGHKQKYIIGQSDEPLYMAGIYRYEQESELPVFVILTKPAAPEIMLIHDRMPVILPKDAQDEWLRASSDVQRVLSQAIEQVCHMPAFLSLIPESEIDEVD